MSEISVTPLSRFDENRYLTYPHANGFIDDGRFVILGERRQDGHYLLRCDVATGETTPIAPMRTGLCDERRPSREFDVSPDGHVLAYVGDNTLWVMDPTGSSSAEAVYRGADGDELHELPNLRNDARRALVMLRHGARHGFIEVDLASGKETWRHEVDFWLGHAQYSPFDPAWVGFCHEGPCDETPDRVWAAPTGDSAGARCIFDQHWDDPERRISAGHERWAFHDRSAFVVAYGQSMGRPRGIYEVFPDGRPQRLVTESDRDWHVNVSLDGRWLAIDTTGPHDASGRGWENAAQISDVVVADVSTGERRFVSRSRLRSHPSHPHPVFTPDARWVLFNEADESLENNRVLRAANPFLG
ncbi:MAG: oligogalacturonate lyase family protein [Capsulimonadaceae bacterium]|nr:oligogalacturonate lyase family protein [Capsulimonadaceae bacterium]